MTLISSHFIFIYPFFKTVIATIVVTLNAFRLYQTQANLFTKCIAILTPKSNLLRNELVSMLEKGYQAQLKVISTKKQYHHLSNNENNEKSSYSNNNLDDDDEKIYSARCVLLSWEEAQFISMSLVKYVGDDCSLYKSWCAFATIQHWKSCKILFNLLNCSGREEGGDDSLLVEKEKKKLEQKISVLPRLAEVWVQRVCSKSDLKGDAFPPSADDWRIYKECCDVQGKYNEMIEILSNVRCGTQKKGRQIDDQNDLINHQGSLIQLSERERLEMMAQLNVKHDQFDVANKIYSEQLLDLLPDQWSYWEELMKCSVRCYDQDHDVASKECSHILQQVLIKQDQLRSEGKASRVPIRAPHLFRIHIIAEGILHCSKKNVEELCKEIVSYGNIFASQIVCCFQDLRRYIELMVQNGTSCEDGIIVTKETNQLVNWAKSIRESNNPLVAAEGGSVIESEGEKSERKAKLRAYIFSIKVILELWYHNISKCDSSDVNKRSALDGIFMNALPSVDELVCLWQNVLNLGSNPNEGGQKEILPGDDLILIATQILIHESKDLSNMQKEHTSFIAGALLEHAISKSPYNPYLKIAAINIYAENDATSVAWEMFQTLNVTHIQLDSCSYIILNHLIDGGLYDEAIYQAGKIIHLHKTSAKDIARFLPQSFENGNVGKGYEMISWQRHEMNNSIQLVQAKSLIMDLAPLLGTSESNNVTTVVGACHGICGDKSTDAIRAEKIVRDSSNFYAAPSILGLSNNSNLITRANFDSTWSDNRDFTINEFEILERRNHPWQIEKLITSAKLHSILTRIVLLIDVTKTPKKGKIINHSPGDDVDIRAQSVIQTINDANTYINNSNNKLSKLHINLWNVKLILCKVICIVSTGRCSMEEEDRLQQSNDTLATRETRCIELLQQALDIMNESMISWKSMSEEFNENIKVKSKFICRLLPESLVPTFIILRITANLFGLFNWGKRKRHTKPIAGAIANVALSFNTIMKEISEGFLKDLPLSKNDAESQQSIVTLKSGVKELISVKLPESTLSIISEVGEGIFSRAIEHKALHLVAVRQRLEPFFVEMINELETFDVTE